MTHLSGRQPFYNKTASSSVKPISLAELKASIGLADQCSAGVNNRLNLIIDAVTECFESAARIVLLEATFQVKFDSFDYQYELRRRNFLAITSVQYIDEDEATQTVASSNYYTISDPYYYNLAFIDDFVFPDVLDREEVVLVNFTAGFGSLATSIPADIKLALLEWASFIFDNGGCDPSASMPAIAKSIIRKYKPIELGGRCHL